MRATSIVRRRRSSGAVDLENFDGRVIRVNNETANLQQLFPTNFVSTTHYTWWNFIPKNLFEQFSRIANFYFLVCAALTLLPLSPYEPYTSIFPLAFVLGVSATREGMEDYSRAKQDRRTNGRHAQVLRADGLEDVLWKDIVVGDICKVSQDERIAADMVLLSSSDDSNLAYVETANLDGETNLKVKSSLSLTSHVRSESDLQALKGIILAEHPSNEIYHFSGRYVSETQERTPILPDNLLLRGCELRNTRYCYGFVIYTGNQTRIEMNAAKTIVKRSNIETQMNKEIIRILVLQALLCTISAIAFGVMKEEEQDGQWYRALSSNVAGEACETWVTWLLLLSVMLPISLYVTLELVKVVQGMHIGWDLKMYYEPLDKPCEVRSVGLNEDLGQISHVFSDKTGTLTRNEMVFMRASVGARQFDYYPSPDATDVEPSKKLFEQLGSLSESEDYKEQVRMFLLNLSLCNAVVPEPNVDEASGVAHMTYLSPSPDEEALVTAAATNGYALFNRTATGIQLNITNPGTEAVESSEYEILRTLEFTSDRKRMSIIVRCPDKRLLLLTKGADTEIYKRLKEGSDEKLKEATTGHLIDFANEGLRTLVLGYTWLEEDYFQEWNQRYHKASLDDDRDAKLEEVNSEMENNLTLCGATAIEDRLQENVPQALTNLRAAGVKVWVLTGDKQETAINIGHSSGLLVNGMHIFVLNGVSEADAEVAKLEKEDELGRKQTQDEETESYTKLSKEHTREILQKTVDQMKASDSTLQTPATDHTVGTEMYTPRSEQQVKRGSHGLGFALVLDSETLRWAIDDSCQPDLRPLFLEAANSCRSVLLCRCTPLQKAQVVRLMKQEGKSVDGRAPVTLAIGDGANDVGMIKEAHIGIGISGKEGMQAVQNSDYAIAQFAYLQRLMLLHGRWNYRRISLLVVYSFYKNIALVLTQFWFGIQSQFGGQTLYDGLAGNVYNVFFTSSILVTAVLDKDASERVLMAHPELYQSGVINERFTTRVFWSWWIEGLYDSIVIYVICVVAMGEAITFESGQTTGGDGMGIIVYTAAVLVVNARLALANNYWTHISWIVLVASIVVWYLFGIVYSWEIGWLLTYTVWHLFFKLFENSGFWLTPLVVTVICSLPAFLKMHLQRDLQSSLKQRLKIIEASGQQLPGELSRTSTAETPGHNPRMLSPDNKATSVIINFGKKNQTESTYTGFAMDHDNKNMIPKPLRRVAKAAHTTTKLASTQMRKITKRVASGSFQPTRSSEPEPQIENIAEE